MLPPICQLYRANQYNSNNRHACLEKQFFYALLIFCEAARIMILMNDRRTCVFMQPCVIYYLDTNIAVFQ